MKGKGKLDIEEDRRGWVSEILESSLHEIAGDANFVKDSGMDSMRALEILAGIGKNIKSLSLKTLCPNSQILMLP